MCKSVVINKPDRDIYRFDVVNNLERFRNITRESLPLTLNKHLRLIALHFLILASVLYWDMRTEKMRLPAA